jgi:hypothetical protein
MKMGVKKGRRWCDSGRWRLRDAAVVMGSGGWRRNGGFGGVWEKKDGDGGGRCVYGTVNVGGGGGGKKENSDLKIGHVRPKYECVRTYVSAFVRICGECVCAKWTLH